MGEVRSPIKKDPAGGSKKRPREPEDLTSDPSTSQEGTSKIMTRSRTGKNKDKEKGITHNRREKAKKTEDGQYAALDDSCSPLSSSEEDK